MLVIGLLLGGLTPGWGATAAEEDLRTPEDLSNLARSECGALLLWGLDSLGEQAARAWRAEYGECVLTAVKEQQILDPIGEHCGEEDYRCVSDMLNESGLGPQYAALVEACFFLNQDKRGSCSYDQLFDPLGFPAFPRGQDCPVRPTHGDCDASPDLEDHCILGLCLGRYMGVEHQAVTWPGVDAQPCTGVKTETTTQTTGSSSASVLNLAIYMRFDITTTVTTSTSVEWDVVCSAEPVLEGYAWGGFMRELRIVEEDTDKIICQYDGIQKRACFGSYEEDAIATADGAYDADEEEGARPAKVMTLSILPDALWRNEPQDSFKVITSFDLEDPVPGDSRDYVVKWEDKIDELKAMAT